jgi:two-component system, OmpR family, response regulator
MSKTGKRVLIVEDTESVRELLTKQLKFAGFEVGAVANGTDAVLVAEKSKPDLIVLDVMLPDHDGFTVVKKLRSMNLDVPVLFLSAKDEPENKVMGLTVGGDDYMTKPFSIDELTARIHAILRRSQKDDTEASLLEVGEISIDQDAHEVFVNGKQIDLSPTEYKLLRFLMNNANRVMSKAQILDHVWEYDFNGEMGIVESYVSYLRKKIDPLSKNELIQTKRGVGYMFRTYKNDEE